MASEEKTDDRQQLNFRCPPELAKWLRVEAITRGVTLEGLMVMVAEAFRERELARREKAIAKAEIRSQERTA